ncbi:uncharacterized protein NPIL_428391 [Nephila pilipes]|uniref:Uncharacterized protein n=1 Tax=Nephila pilipes TaxID=299642 RepID=A0A8X6I9D9_NEPPI|nr:uncharacterized protein NPIL_428391 [Nephila pilipes]
MFFVLFQIFGIEVKRIKKRSILHFAKNCPKYFVSIVIVIELALQMQCFILLSDKTDELAHIGLTVLLLIVYGLIYRRRQAMLLVIKEIDRANKKLQLIDFKGYKYPFIAIFVILVVLTSIWTVWFFVNEGNMIEDAENILKMNSTINFLKIEPSYYLLVFRAIAWLDYFIRCSILSFFTLYYSLVCSFIRHILRLLLKQLKVDCLPDHLKEVLYIYADTTNCVERMDKEFSLPVCLIVLMCMIGVFWGGYRVVFQKNMTTENLLPLLYCAIFYSFLLILIISSAALTNESINETKTFMHSLKCKIPLLFQEIDLNCTRNVLHSSSLTLWKIYEIDRSLLFSCIGALLTYGILIGTLGKES